jgi:hypothetical protein
MRRTTFVLVCAFNLPAALSAQTPTLTVLFGGTPLGNGAVPLNYNTDRNNPSLFSGTPQLLQVRSTPPVNFSVTPASGYSTLAGIGAGVGSFLQYAVVSPNATDCSSANYTQTTLTTTTPVGICVAAVNPTQPLDPGYLSASLNLVPIIGRPVKVPIFITVSPTGYLQLTRPYPNTSFNGQSIPFSLTNLVSAPASIPVHVNVFDNNAVINTPDDTKDKKNALYLVPQNDDGSPALWIIATLTDVNTQAPTSTSPALLNLSVDPMKIPPGTQTFSGKVSISSGQPYPGSNFVQITGTLPQAPAPQFTGPASLTFSNGGSSSQAFTLDSTGASISFSVTSDSPWLSATPVSGVTPQQITVAVNPSNLMPGTYNGILTFSDTTGASPSFPVAVAYAITGTAPITRALAHVADGNQFTTTVILTNPDTNNPAAYQLRLFDEGGNPQTQRFELASGALSGVIPAGGEVTIRTQGLGSQTVQGWADLTAPPQVGASIIYAQRNPNLPSLQEGTAVVSATGSGHFFLPFDNTGIAATAVALTNSSTAAANVTFTFRYNGGGTDVVSLPSLAPRSHVAFALASRFFNSVGKTGVVEVSSTIGIFAVAFRFNSTGAFTAFNSVAATASKAAVTSPIAHAADGNAFTTTIILTNPDLSDPAAYTLRFNDDNGNPAVQGFALASGALAGTVPPGGSVTIQTSGQGAQTVPGWAELTAPGQVGANVIYGQKNSNLPSLQEGTTTLGAGLRHFFLPFDNTNGAVTALALTNVGAATANVSVVLRYDNGATETPAFGSPALQPRNHQAFTLQSRFPNGGGKAGVAEFTSDVDLVPVAFRFNSSGAFTAFAITQP